MNVIPFPARMSRAERYIRDCTFFNDYTTPEQLSRAIEVFNEKCKNPWDELVALGYAAQELKK